MLSEFMSGTSSTYTSCNVPLKLLAQTGQLVCRHHWSMMINRLVLVHCNYRLSLREVRSGIGVSQRKKEMAFRQHKVWAGTISKLGIATRKHWVT